MKKASLWWHSVRHTRLRQLRMRLWLTAKRRVREALAPWARALHPASAGASFRSAEQLPRPLFPPRTESLIERDGLLRVRFLMQECLLTFPMEWRPHGQELGTELFRMNLHYMEYLEAVDDETLMSAVGDWIDANPPYRRGEWRDIWNAYSVSIRCVVWMQQYAARAGRMPEGFRVRMAASLVEQLRYLEGNLELDLGGNHLMKNVKALLWASRFFEGADAERWGARGRRLLDEQRAEQILPDGLHYERSPSYHAQVFADLLECFFVLDRGPERDRLSEDLDRMAQVLADTTHPDGLVSLCNDGGLHAAYAPALCLDVHRALGGQRVTPRATFALEAAGYFGARHGGSYVLADCGPIGPDFLPAHGHGDILSFEWSVATLRMIVDAGVYEYAAGIAREYSRSTRAHNTVTVADLDQCEFWDRFRVGRRARARVHRYAKTQSGFVLLGSHDGYRRLAGHPIHRRRFAAAPEKIEVEDAVLGGAGQPVRARLLCHPDCRVEMSGGGLVSIRRDDVHATLRTESPARVETAWWSPDFGIRFEAPSIVIEYGGAPCAGGFTLSVVHSGER